MFVEEFFRAATLDAGYNSALVIVATTLFGATTGFVGAFVFLRKQTLLSDAVAHATLPGVAGAFLAGGLLFELERSFVLLLLGALLAGLLSIVSVQLLSRLPRVNEDSAIAIVLASFFGFGIVLLSVVQQVPLRNRAGVDGFIYGHSSGLLISDLYLLLFVSFVTAAVAWASRKEFLAISFDSNYSASLGWSTFRIDLLLFALMLAVTVLGLVLVGALLVVAMFVIPPVAARFWCLSARTLILVSALIGAISAYIGSVLSSAVDNLPVGAVIVLCAGAFFLFSALLAPDRGLVSKALLQFRNRMILIEDLLLLSEASAFEVLRGEGPFTRFIVPFLMWRRGFVGSPSLGSSLELTEKGREEAARRSRFESEFRSFLDSHSEINISQLPLAWSDRVHALRLQGFEFSSDGDFDE